MKWLRRCSIGGSSGKNEIPLLLMSFYLFRDVAPSLCEVLALRLVFGPADLCGRHSQVGSLAGAAHLLNDNAGVLR